MDSLRSVLEQVARDVEPQVRAQLGGFFGGMVRAYLPQTWVFRTEREVASLTVGGDGGVAVADGAAATPDVTIESTAQHLTAALTARSRSKVPRGALHVTAHTPKGQTAFDYLRGRLGL